MEGKIGDSLILAVNGERADRATLNSSGGMVFGHAMSIYAAAKRSAGQGGMFTGTKRSREPLHDNNSQIWAQESRLVDSG